MDCIALASFTHTHTSRLGANRGPDNSLKKPKWRTPSLPRTAHASISRGYEGAAAEGSVHAGVAAGEGVVAGLAPCFWYNDDVSCPAAARTKENTVTTQSNDTSRGARLIREALESHGEVVARWKKLRESLGIEGQAIGAKRLRQLLLASGINSDENTFSRDIIAMREE
jgi:hypothetical protein